MTQGTPNVVSSEMVDGGILPGSAFEDIPDTWVCPVCGARKCDFVPVD
jgi:rubredoxin